MKNRKPKSAGWSKGAGPDLSIRFRAEIWILSGIILLGLLLRALYLAEIVDNPDFEFPLIDPGYHDYWARGLVTGDWIVPPGREDPQVFRYPFYRPPGYPYFLSILYRIKMDYLFPRIANMIIGLGSALMAFILGRRWWGRGTGLIFAALTAVYWIFIYFEGELVGESATVFLGLGLILVLSRLADRATFLRCFSGGLVLGLYALFRPNVLIFLPFSAVWLLWVLRRRRQTARWLKTVPGLVLGTVIMLIPSTVRNLTVSGEFVPIATNLGVSLAVANNEFTDGTIHIIPGIDDMGTPFDWPRIVRRLERISGRELTHREASSYLVDQALDFIRENPLDFLALLGKKALFFWGPREIRNLREIHFARMYSPVLNRIPFNFPLVETIALVGFLLLFLENRKVRPRAGERGSPEGKRWESTVLLLFFIGSYFISMLPFAAAARYRVPIIPFLLCLGSSGLNMVGGAWRRREWKQAILWTGGGAVFFALFSINLSGYEPSLDRWHYDLALAYTDRQDWESAIREYREVIRLQPTAIRAYNNLGNIYTQREDYTRAVDCYEQIIRLRPDLAQPYNNLGSVLFRMEKLDAALGFFQAALRLRPDMAETHNNMGNVYFRKGDYEAAVKSYREALKYKPFHASIHFNLGKARVKQGRLEEAVTHYSEALRINPDHQEARENLNRLLRIRNRAGDAETR
ncbi:MAG: tetratricopeptide repeat protein [PVC group bacterium]